MAWRRKEPVISSHGIDLLILEYFGFSTKRVKPWFCGTSTVEFRGINYNYPCTHTTNFQKGAGIGPMMSTSGWHRPGPWLTEQSKWKSSLQILASTETESTGVRITVSLWILTGVCQISKRWYNSNPISRDFEISRDLMVRPFAAVNRIMGFVISWHVYWEYRADSRLAPIQW